MTIQENIPLKDFSTFRIGGPARYFIQAMTSEELRQALEWARRKKVPYFILGGGSNLLFSDSGFDGLVIRPSLQRLTINDTTVDSGSSVLLSELIEQTLAQGLTGLEFAAGIPGTLGGAIRGNAGTYGIAISDVILNISFIDEHDFTLTTIEPARAQFSYRHSMFKQHRHIIVEAQLTLKRGDVEASKKIIAERIELRHTSHPSEPSAGCIFKNVEFDRVDIDSLQKKGIQIERFKQFRKIPSGYLIEQLGLKGMTIGGARVSEQHANYVINTGTASFEDVMTLVSYIKQQVRDTYGIQLEEEVHIVGG